jgi:hypothetical protein
MKKLHTIENDDGSVTVQFLEKDGTVSFETTLSAGRVSRIFQEYEKSQAGLEEGDKEEQPPESTEEEASSK